MHGRAAKLTQQKGAVAPWCKQVVSNGICVLAKNALLDVVQNRGLEAFTDCPWREILLNAANAKPFTELGSYLRKMSSPLQSPVAQRLSAGRITVFEYLVGEKVIRPNGCCIEVPWPSGDPRCPDGNLVVCMLGICLERLNRQSK
jgi:hypothetical protein